VSCLFETYQNFIDDCLSCKFSWYSAIWPAIDKMDLSFFFWIMFNYILWFYCSYASMLHRDLSRLDEICNRINVCPLGRFVWYEQLT